MTREEIINSMCFTWRHDYALMDEQEQKNLFQGMAQIFDNDIAKELMMQSSVDDYEEQIEELENQIQDFKSKSCEGCIYLIRKNSNGNIPLSCCECSRFYSDNFEEIKK